MKGGYFVEKIIYPCYYGEKLMPWAKGVVVKNANGYIFLGGVEGHDTEAVNIQLGEETGRQNIPCVEGAEAQTRLIMQKIKFRLEEMGSSLENIVKMTISIKGPDFPDGVANHPTWLTAAKVMNEFFKEHCPDLCWDRHPVVRDPIGVAGLGAKDMLLEISIIAVLPD